MLTTQVSAQITNSQRIGMISELKRLAFASCNKHTRQQTLWKKIALQNPDLFMWGGDIVYADKDGITGVKLAYEYQNKVPDYASFKSFIPVIGIWDDHDYGKNNGDNFYEHKKISKEYLLNFLNEPKDSPRRAREGIYTSYDFGPAGKKIKIIMLDNRYFKDETEGALLGKNQWAWLEQELKNSDANLHLIVSGISILTPKTIHTEEWSDYPDEKVRLSKLMKSTRKPYLYVAGDRHYSDIFSQGDELEFLASGMTHNAPVLVRNLLRKMYPNPIFEHNYGLIDFSWDKGSPIMNLSIRTENGKSFNSKKIKWENARWKVSAIK